MQVRLWFGAVPRWWRVSDRVWLTSALIVTGLFILVPAQGAESLVFAIRNLLTTAPFLVLSIGLAAYADATGADALVARAFTGAPVVMVLFAAAAGGLSPFCSCGVIPLIAALLSMGVPLSAVMAFWQFWRDKQRVSRFWREALKASLFLTKWLLLAFLLESLMLAYVPADLIADLLGGEGVAPIAAATLIGVPAYLNGYAALPLVGGLVQQGMAPGAALAFLVAGGVTSLPAAIAVFALVRKQVFALYLLFALSGSLAAGLLFQAWSSV